MKTLSNNGKVLFLGLYNTLNNISKQAFIAQGRDMSSHLMKFVRVFLQVQKQCLQYCSFLGYAHNSFMFMTFVR